MKKIFLLLALGFGFSSSALAVSEGTGLKLTGAVDLTGVLSAKDQSRTPKRFEARGAEVGMYGPIDHGFDGALFLGAHNEDGAYNFELHEAYLASSKLVPNLRLKLGKFFLGVGRLNRFHRHDWPFLTIPFAHETFFDEEAVSDTGLQANYLLPFMPVYTELSAGLTNGWTYGHSHNQGAKPVVPTHYARIENFFSLGETGGLQTGLNYLGRNGRSDGQMRLYGLDLTAKWREAAYVKWLLQSEIWGRNLRPVNGELERAYGGYLYGQRHLYGPLSLGLRLDGYTVDTSPTSNLDYAVSSHLTYAHSEFALFRAAYQWDYEKRDHRDSQVNRALHVQAVFFLGDHPSHDF